jgi:hypothetical protein
MELLCHKTKQSRKNNGLEGWLFNVSTVDSTALLNPCGGGVEYLHRDPASRKRRRNGAKKGRAVA